MVRSVAINPPKMCQPMGAILAYMGVHGCVPLVHGSQGCSTYPRYNIARHFRESAEVAVSSLSEDAAVYGGAKNLTEAIKNIKSRLNPEAIGICTTCMSETIGDDVKLISKKALQDDPVKIFPASTPSYVGTHLTGYDNALRTLVETLAVKGETNNKINIITGIINPGDIREIKNMLRIMNVSSIFLSDISDTLDSPILPGGHKPMLPEGGTSLSDIADSANSLGTIAICRAAGSAATYLKNKFNVPAVLDPAPIGVTSTDRFVRNISRLGGASISPEIVIERGRLIDSMVDVHHYMFGRKVAIFGDPDIVSAIVRFCAEAGMAPTVAMTATRHKDFAPDIKAVNSEYKTDTQILEGTDLYEFHEVVKTHGAELIVGNSKGKDIADDENVPLVRVGFPVYDRVGVYRYPIMGYNGSIYLLDQMTNAILGHRYDPNKLHQ
ncbi:nitrogenase component 1 [Candidatus Methanoperedens nitratireducens]|uniref:Nitrogenase molybdenum-iron protein beta chain n=1 Tax=Candidatus Methanoperedens nitratireducens TaxID=1392998 RepID=A0A284VUA7_9EURY|nr:nitrogenase component 1 [Candidatus Methanoperedens nitroreducens]SNQ62870.1 Nitrogenase molybdenum-iron protein beta chain [Candidatus Methanoperedens nitroreducens]